MFVFINRTGGIVYIKEAHLTATRADDGSIEAKLTVSDQPPEGTDPRDRISQMDNTELAEFVRGERGEASGDVVWAASGVLPVISVAEGTFVAMGLRDAQAPSHAGHFASASGLSESPDELLDPTQIGAREGIEEILFALTNEGSMSSWMVPDVALPRVHPQAHLTPLHRHWEQAANTHTKLLNNGPEPELDKREYPSLKVDAAVHSVGTDILQVKYDGGASIQHGHIVIDPESGAIDLMMVLHIDLSEYSLSDIRLFDGESMDDKLVNREVFLFELNEYVKLVDSHQPATAHRRYQSGKVWDGTNWGSRYENGSPIVIEDADVVPNARGTGVLVESLKDQYSV